MPRPPTRLSLRSEIQASSLLAVLAGYTVLLLANRQLATMARLERHRQAVDLVRQQLVLSQAPQSPSSFQAILDRMETPGRLCWLEVESGTPYQPPSQHASLDAPVPVAALIRTAALSGQAELGSLKAFSLADRQYLSSSLPLMFNGRPARLRLVEDVSADAQRERTSQLLVLGVAGISCLFTSVLLRLVMRSGLRPLDQLSDQLESFDAENLGGERLSLTVQPQELKPIVRSFNGLLDRLELGRQRQQAFVDGVAHELRTPITLISGYAQRLARQGSGGEAAEQISREASRMGRLVADLLDIARDEAGRLELLTTRIDLDEVLLTAYERLSPLAPGRLLLHPPAEGSAPLAWGDAERLQHCLTNLVENALKYTPAGSRIELFSSSDDQEVIAHVRDYGPGVLDADKERIFGRFVRGSLPTVWNDSGTGTGSGIGLSVVKLLMERMGGSVRVVDASGEGADFQLRLPTSRLEGPG